MHGVASVTNDFTLPACTERVVRRLRRLGIGVSAICENLRNLRILPLEPEFRRRCRVAGIIDGSVHSFRHDQKESGRGGFELIPHQLNFLTGSN
jgi:hypothetical protein